MKLFLSALVLISSFSFAAQAMPAIGDYAKYRMDYTLANGQTGTMYMEQELLALNSGFFDVQQTTTMADGSKTVKVEQKKAEDFLSDETVNYVMNNCAAAKGELTSVDSCYLGKVTTCRITSVDNDQTSVIHIYPVSFGIHQATVQNQQIKMTMTVIDARRGKN